MNLKQTVATALMTVVAFASLALMPASADSNSSASLATGTQAVAALNGMETPQHLVWDMTYGDQGPMPTVAPAEESAVTAENKDVVDLSMG